MEGHSLLVEVTVWELGHMRGIGLVTMWPIGNF